MSTTRTHGLGSLARLMGVALAAVLMLASASRAAAQGTLAMRWAAVEPADIELMVKTLNLDEDQTTLVNGLFDGLQAARREGEEQYRDQVIEARRPATEQQTPEAYRQVNIKITELREQWEDRQTAMATAFFDDVKALLRDDQAKQWPLFERERRRRTTLDFGARLSGERVDLIALVDELELDEEPRARMNPTLEQYATELDIALVARNRAIDELQSNMRQQMTQVGQFEQAQPLFEEAARRREALRDVNFRYVDVIAAQLPADRNAEFRDLFLAKAYPRVYGPTRVERYLELLEKAPNLTDEQRMRIDGIRVDWESRSTPLNEELAQLERQREDLSQVVFLSRTPTEESQEMSDRRSEVNTRYRDLWRMRRELEQETVRRLQEVLSQEQREHVAQDEERMQRERGGAEEAESSGEG